MTTHLNTHDETPDTCDHCTGPGPIHVGHYQCCNGYDGLCDSCLNGMPAHRAEVGPVSAATTGIQYRTVHVVSHDGERLEFDNLDSARAAMQSAAQRAAAGDGMDSDGEFSGSLSWGVEQVPATPVDALLDEYADQSHADIFQPHEAIDMWFPEGLPTAGVILVEENVRGGYWLSAHPDIAAALHYQDNQEHAEDFTIEKIVDVATGEDLTWNDEYTHLEAVRALCSLRSRLGRIGEDVHAGNVERLARGITDNTLTVADAAARLRAMPCPQAIRTYLNSTALHLESDALHLSQLAKARQQ